MGRPTAFTNRKKVRGWKTQIRRVEHWRERYLTPDWAHFEKYGYDYCKIQIDPWNRLVKRQPPLWLGRLMLTGLLDIHQAWATVMPDAPYLRVWLKWPDLMGSQVVVAGDSQAERYKDAFRPVADLGWAAEQGFPPQFGGPLLKSLRSYRWVECLDEYEVDPDDMPREWLNKRPHSTLIPEGGDFITLVERGRIWVGERPTAEGG